MMKDTRMLQTSDSNSEACPLTLANIALDLQIIICTLLHPSDILALRETCKALQFSTRQRVVWVAALRRVCLDNSLFLPSFPILDMNDEELEHAAMAPLRWINLCTAFEKQHLNDSDAKLRPRKARIIDSVPAARQLGLFVVPGGRYMVSCSHNGIFIWDLGYSNADCKLVASTGPEDGLIDSECYSFMVQATSDGTGLIILSSSSFKHSVYEIYPQSETPQLTRIAHLGPYPVRKFQALLLPDRVLWYRSDGDSIAFRVWDYRTNHSIGFSAKVGFRKEYYLKIIATKTAIFVICFEEILVWAIPPLSPQPPDFSDHNSTHIPPFFGIPYPDGLVRRHDDFLFFESQTMSPWYFGSSQRLYFHILCHDSRLHRFEIIVGPSLLDTSLRMINTEFFPDEFDNVTFQRYNICEDSIVAYSEKYRSGQFGVYTWPRFTTVVCHDRPATKVSLPRTPRGYNFCLCPTSGRYVHLDIDILGIVVVDLF